MSGKFATSFWAGILCVLSISPSYAQDEALYDAPPPEDAAFVRFLGFDAQSIAWHGLTFDAAENGLQDYYVVHAAAIESQPGDIFTVIPGADDDSHVPLIEDARSRGKITLALLNLSDGALDLRTSDGSVPIIADVGAGGIGFREVNPLAVEVAVFAGAEVYGAPLAVSLRREEHMTFVAAPDGTVRAVVSGILSGVVE